MAQAQAQAQAPPPPGDAPTSVPVTFTNCYLVDSNCSAFYPSQPGSNHLTELAIRALDRLGEVYTAAMNNAAVPPPDASPSTNAVPIPSNAFLALSDVHSASSTNDHAPATNDRASVTNDQVSVTNDPTSASAMNDPDSVMNEPVSAFLARSNMHSASSTNYQVSVMNDPVSAASDRVSAANDRVSAANDRVSTTNDFAYNPVFGTNQPVFAGYFPYDPAYDFAYDPAFGIDPLFAPNDPTSSTHGLASSGHGLTSATHDLPSSSHSLASSATPLANAMTLQHVLSNSRAWDVLDEDEKVELLSLIPPCFHPNTSITPIPALDDDFLLYSTDWSGGIRQFTEDVRAGRYASRFRADAEKASRERAVGKLTPIYQQANYNHAPRITIPSQKVKLETLVAHGVFMVGDVLACRYGGVEKEFAVHSISGKQMTVSYDNEGTPVHFKDITGPDDLVKQAWRKLKLRVGGGAWKVIKGWQNTTCRRGNVQLGTLDGMRDAWNRGI